MFEDAAEELAAIPLADQARTEYLALALDLAMARKLWNEGITLATELYRREPNNPDLCLHLAFCLHETGRTEDARNTLVRGPASLAKISTYYYNLACYEAQLGNLDSARSRLEIAIQMEPTYRKCSLEDPDLAPLRNV